jgi:Mce-associated membrane protein
MTSSTGSPSPTWYDVLGVSHDATPDQVKAAWRNATDKFEPGSGSGQFRMFNEAADVLLDPERRAAYDETLATSPRTDAPVPPPAPATDRPSGVVLTKSAAEPADRLLTRREKRAAAATVAGGRAEPPRTHARASRTAGLLTLLLLLLTVGAVVAAVVVGLQARTEARTADGRDEAPAAAERAAKAMLAYDYRTLPADRKRASAYLTADYRPKYLENFEQLEKQKDGAPGLAVQTKTVVTTSVLGSGVMDASEDKVRVLVYVNQVSTRPGRDPQIFQNRVAMTMEKVGNRWLVDALKSY